MKIERKTEKIWGKAGSFRISYEDKENGKVYGRIVGGFGWPFCAKPGFVVVVAEDLKPDYSIPHAPRHLHMLAECESDDFEQLHRECLRYLKEFQATNLYGDTESALYEVWKKSFNKDSASTVSLTQPLNFEILDTNFAAQLIKLHTSGRKTLHFGQSKLPSYLGLLQSEDLEREELGHHPAIAALSYALDCLVNSQYSEGIFTPNRMKTARPRGRRTSRFR